MSFETDFDTAFTVLLGKARAGLGATTTTGGGGQTGTDVTTYSVPFVFTGGGASITTTLAEPILVEGCDAGDIISAHIWALNHSGALTAISATVTLTGRLFGVVGTTSLGSFVLTAQSSADASASVTGHLEAGQALIGRLTAISGAATSVTAVIRVRRD